MLTLKSGLALVLFASVSNAAFAMSPTLDLVLTCNAGATKISVYHAGGKEYTVSATARKGLFGERSLSIWAKRTRYTCPPDVVCDGGGEQFTGKDTETGETVSLNISVSPLMPYDPKADYQLTFADGKKKSGRCTYKYNR